MAARFKRLLSLARINLPLASKWQQASRERERNSAHLGSLVVEPLRGCCQKANQFEKRLLTSLGSPRIGFPNPRLSRSENPTKPTPATLTQCRSNPVSSESLPKTGIFAVVAGDFSRKGLRVLEFGSSETGAELQKPAKSGPFSALRGTFSGFRTAWLGREDSNLYIPN